MKESILNRKQTALNEELHSIKTLVIGDSHLAAAFNTKIFGNNSYNYATSGENYLQNYYKLRTTLEQPNTIKTVIVPFELHSASSFRNNRITDYSYWGKHIPFFKEAVTQRNTKFLNDFLKAQTFSYLGEFDQWRSWIKGRKIVEIREGVEMRSQNFANNPNQKQIAEKYAKLHFNKAKTPDSYALTHLRKIIQLCQENHIQTILVRSPVSKIYLEQVAKYHNINQLEKELNSYKEKHFSDIPFLDFKDSIQSLRLYSDANHLNFEGASLLSQQLVQKIQSQNIKLE